MAAEHSKTPIVHFVGSIPLPDAEAVFRTLAEAAGPYLLRLPDGETGIRKTWIRFLQTVLAENPAIEVATDVPPFKFTQWDGKVLREIPRLRIKPGAKPDPNTFKTGYAEMAIASWSLFERLQNAGVIPANVKFQVSIPTPIAPTYNNMVPSDRPALLPVLTAHFIGEVEKIAAAIPNDRIAVQWDVCQEVLAWEGYYEAGPIDFRNETINVCPRAAPTTAISRPSNICACPRRLSFISASFITTMRKAMRPGWLRPGATDASAASPRNAGWRAAIRGGCPHSSRRMSVRPKSQVVEIIQAQPG
jgi:hypothetical protein